MTNEDAENTGYLSLRFDGSQTGTVLWYKFGTGTSLITSGANAGAFSLPAGGKLEIKVNGVADKDSGIGIELNELTLVCMPVAGSMQNSLSPFSSGSATVTISKWTKSPPKTFEDGSTSYVFRHVLDLDSTEGHWRLSGFLSAQIFQNTVNPGSLPVYQRSYTFDPEVIVGGGTRPLE